MARVYTNGIEFSHAQEVIMVLPRVLPSEQPHRATSEPLVPTTEANHSRLQGLYTDPEIAAVTEEIRSQALRVAKDLGHNAPEQVVRWFLKQAGLR